MVRVSLTTALAVLVLLPVTARGAGERFEWTGVRRIVAIGDVHGAFDNFVAILKTARLVDEELRWVGSDAHLVQTGDVLDRGSDSRKVMELLMRLEREAKKAGGRVHALIGNHEAMNVVGILDHVSPAELAAFVDSDSEARRARALRASYEREKKSQATARSEDEAGQDFVARHPLGYLEHRAAFSPAGRYGRWILSHNAAVQIDGLVFSHGDWSEAMSALGIAEVNRRIRDELSGKSPLEEGIAFHPESPLQYRGISKIPLEGTSRENHRPTVDRVLWNLGAKAMVVGHTVTRGVIETRFSGRHISIDAGMLELYDGGHRVALEIEGERFYALHPGGRIELPRELDEGTWASYVAAVASVDPDNRTVRGMAKALESDVAANR